MSSNPVLGFTRDGNKGFKVIETERSRVAPDPGLILERLRESRCEERSILATILPDRRLDDATSHLVRRFVVGSHLVSSFVEMKLALAQKEESQCTFQGGNVRQGPCAGEEAAVGVTA